MDGGHDNQTMNLQQEMIFEHNIVGLFDKYGVPAEPDYVSVDIDSYDLWVFKAILTSGKYRPRVLTAEYNCNCPLGATFSFPNDPLERWDAWREGFDTAGRCAAPQGTFVPTRRTGSVHVACMIRMLAFSCARRYNGHLALPAAWRTAVDID